MIDTSLDHDDEVENLGTGRIANPQRDGPARLTAARLAKELAGLQGTVTEFLEDLVKEKIYADKLEQVQTTAIDTNGLLVGAGHPLMRRTALLRGQESSRAYLYAETLVVSSRLPWAMRERLDSSADPIGRVIVEQGLAVTRVHYPPESRLPRAIGRVLLARRYRLDLSGLPVMEISEWFLSALEEFVGRTQ